MALKVFCHKWTDDMYDKYNLDYLGGGGGDNEANADPKELQQWDQKYELGLLTPEEQIRLLKLRLQIQVYNEKYELVFFQGFPDSDSSYKNSKYAKLSHIFHAHNSSCD